MSELTAVLADLLAGRPTWRHVDRLAEPPICDPVARWRYALAWQVALLGCSVTLPDVLLDTGGWTERDLVESARCLAEAGERKVLSHLALWHTGLVVAPLCEAPRDPRPWLDALLAIAGAIDHQLPYLVDRLAELGAIDDALRTTWAITWPRTLVDAVVDLAPRLAPDDRRALVDHAWQRVCAWHLPVPYGIEELAELVEHIDAPEARERALSELRARVDALPRADLQTSCDPENPVLSLARAVRVCRGLDAAMAELDARLGDEPWEWMWCTLELADALPDTDPARDALGQRALRVAITHHHDDAEPIVARSAWRATRLGPDSATLALDHLLATPDDPQLDEELALALLSFVEHAPRALSLHALDHVGDRLMSRPSPHADALAAWLDAAVDLGAPSRITDAMRADWLTLGRRTVADSDELLCSLVPLLTPGEATALLSWLDGLDDDTIDGRFVVEQLHQHHPELAPATSPPSATDALVAHRRRWLGMALDRIEDVLTRALEVAGGHQPIGPARPLDEAWRIALTEMAPDHWHTACWLVTLARLDRGPACADAMLAVITELRAALTHNP